MAEHPQMIQEFVNVTGVDDERAEFYLSSAGWRLQVALSNFYEHRDEDDEPMAALSAAAAAAGPQPGPSVPALPAAAATDRSPVKQQPAGSADSRRITTLASLQPHHGHQHSSDSESEEGQAYYAGGSEESGQQILGPPKKKNQKPDEVVEALFKSAKDHGAEVVEPDDASRSAARRKQAEASARMFAGAGYRLGESEGEPSEVVPAATGSRGPQAKKIDCVLRLWRTGFTVDDGPLREFTKPENAEFLSAISKGEVPKELIRQARGSEVSLNMEDHRTEDYVPPKVQVKAFAGHGQMLGSPAPQVAASSGAAAVALAAAAASSPAKQQAGNVQVDETQPTTSLQIRLADGTRLTAKFNLSHTVDDVRRYVRSARLQYAAASFVLLTTFPNRELTDGTATLKDANLLNAVIVQKMI